MKLGGANTARPPCRNNAPPRRSHAKPTFETDAHSRTARSAAATRRDQGVASPPRAPVSKNHSIMRSTAQSDDALSPTSRHPAGAPLRGEPGPRRLGAGPWVPALRFAAAGMTT